MYCTMILCNDTPRSTSSCTLLLLYYHTMLNSVPLCHRGRLVLRYCSDGQHKIILAHSHSQHSHCTYKTVFNLPYATSTIAPRTRSIKIVWTIDSSITRSYPFQYIHLFLRQFVFGSQSFQSLATDSIAMSALSDSTNCSMNHTFA